MTSILVIAKNAFLESIRGRKILHVLLVVTILIIAWASTLHVFALGVQVKFIKDVCLSAISIFGTLIALVVSCGQLPNEIENRTIYPLLAKPVRRSEIIIGKFLGAVSVIFLNVILMSAIFLGILFLKERTIDFAIVEAIYLMSIELTAISALCIFFSTFFSTAANVSITFFIYIFGHVKVAYLNYLVGKIDNSITHFLLRILDNPVLPPNLENFNIKEAIIWGKLVGLSHLVLVTLYGLLLVTIYLSSGYLVFRKKNL
jgi:ABC-type transport system involved in multi-copper enzyme maturation permease subunit